MPHLEISPKPFTVAVIALFCVSEQNHCTLVIRNSEQVSAALHSTTKTKSTKSRINICSFTQHYQNQNSTKSRINLQGSKLVLKIHNISTITKTWAALHSIFQVLINSLVRWFCRSALCLALFQISIESRFVTGPKKYTVCRLYEHFSAQKSDWLGLWGGLAPARRTKPRIFPVCCAGSPLQWAGRPGTSPRCPACAAAADGWLSCPGNADPTPLPPSPSPPAAKHDVVTVVCVGHS